MAQRVRVPRFVGGTNVLRSVQASNERSFNCFPETTQGGGKSERYLRRIEGLRPFTTIGDIDTSVLFEQNGRCFAACGLLFAEIFADGTSVVRGHIAYDGTPATIVANGTAGHQVCVVSAKNLYIYDTVSDAFNRVAVPNVTDLEIRQCEFMDGYFFAVVDDSRRVYYSALEDGTSWAELDYFERSWGSDNVAFVKRAGRQLWVVGDATSEVWADNGNANTPFAPIQGAFIDMGAAAWASGQRDGSSVTWLAKDERGGGLLVQANGYEPRVLSAYGVVSRIQLPGNTLAGAEGLVHQLDGHRFYWLYIPGLDTTLVYDFIEQEWHERAMWSVVDGTWSPHIVRSHCYAFEKHLVGVRSTGVVYEMSPDYQSNQIIG